MWLVCSTRYGELSIMTRQERETMISVLIDQKQPIPNHVIECFEEKEKAEKYMFNLDQASKTINKILNS